MLQSPPPPSPPPLSSPPNPRPDLVYDTGWLGGAFFFLHHLPTPSARPPEPCCQGRRPLYGSTFEPAGGKSFCLLGARRYLARGAGEREDGARGRGDFPFTGVPQWEGQRERRSGPLSAWSGVSARANWPVLKQSAVARPGGRFAFVL